MSRDASAELAKRRGSAAEAFATAQRVGDIGERSLERLIEHCDLFVDALSDVRGRVLDLGTGPGVPGLLIAASRPDLEVVLLDRRRHRIDRLTMALRRSGLTNGVPICGDAVNWHVGPDEAFDAVVARSFGPVSRVMEIAGGVVRLGGLLVVSEPPGEMDRWGPMGDLRAQGWRMESRGRVAVLRRLER